MFYAQINKSTKICNGVIQTTGKIKPKDLPEDVEYIKIKTLDNSMLDKKWDGT